MVEEHEIELVEEEEGIEMTPNEVLIANLGTIQPHAGDEHDYEKILAHGMVNRNPEFVLDYCLGRIMTKQGENENRANFRKIIQETLHKLIQNDIIDGTKIISAWHQYRNQLIQLNNQAAATATHPDPPKAVNPTSPSNKAHRSKSEIPWERIEIFAADNPCLRLNHKKHHTGPPQVTLVEHARDKILFNTEKPKPVFFRTNQNTASTVHTLSSSPHRANPFTTATSPISSRSELTSPPAAISPSLYGGQVTNWARIQNENKAEKTLEGSFKDQLAYFEGSRPVLFPGEPQSTWTASNGPPPWPFSDDNAAATTYFDSDTLAPISRQEMYNNLARQMMPSISRRPKVHSDCVLVPGVNPDRRTNFAQVLQNRKKKIYPIKHSKHEYY